MYRDNYKPDQSQPPNYQYIPPYQPYHPIDPMMHNGPNPSKYYETQLPINPSLPHNMSLTPNNQIMPIDPTMNQLPQYHQPTYQNRYYWQQPTPTSSNNPDIIKMRGSTQKQYPDNIIKKIASLISFHLPELQKQMSKATMNIRSINRQKQSRPRRSRSRQSKHRERSRQKLRKTDDRQWVCKKCTFNNFDFRNRCKRCDELRE